MQKTRMRRIIGFSLLLLAVVFPVPSFAESKSKPVNTDPVKDGHLRPGVIASSGKNQQGGATDLNASTEAAGDKESPISASISQQNRKCAVTLTNTEKSGSYSVSYTVEGYNRSGSKVLSTPFSATVPAGKPVTRSFSCQDDLNLKVVLRSGHSGSR